MKTNSPTHEAVTQHARDIWLTRGCPEGCDNEIWLEAEQQLAAAALAASATTDANVRGSGNSQGSTTAVDAMPLKETPDTTDAKTVRQRREARAPQMPPKRNAPKAKTPETGKPLWARPHSS